MKAQYQGFIGNNINTTPALVPETMAHILALEGLEERECVAHLQGVVREFIPQTYGKKALDLAAGRGVAAMTLAEMGFRVAAFNVYRSSISVIQKLALKEELNISFGVGGILQLAQLNEKFDLIHDRECLTRITSSDERALFLAGVRNSLEENGKFVLTTLVWDENYVPDEGFESVYLDNNYILWRQTPESDAAGVVEMNGRHWTAQQRIAPPEMIRLEVMSAGFKILLNKLEVPEDGGPATLKLVLTSAFER